MKDTHWVGHFQFCPEDSTIGSFCHEGPWNLVTQRIWLLDFASREVKPCFRQDEQDSIGHEFWTQDGYLFFDDRGPGHDGTITSARTQAVATDVQVNQNAMIPFVGLADRNGNVVQAHRHAVLLQPLPRQPGLHAAWSATTWTTWC